ncbi:uncharacterized protein LOC131151073 [Malania oleifera]|uniref:uncharacterized protein LOC131151073 n=1 Tax=Malania oleifera TaxID=397392 RepID=UPI0025AE563A|nr:uncharacterized protein LOC131151073 [Malania oleifera]XP_057958235.1 uncharacterized protein LOC131151073 [Malania oleifera]
MSEQLENRILGLEQGQEEINDKISKVLELLMNKGKAVHVDPEVDVDPAHPPGFTPDHGQTSIPPPGVMGGPPPNMPPFIPAMPAQGFPVVGTPPLVPSDMGISKSEAERRCDVLEERLKAMEGSNTFDSVNPNDLCLVPKVTLPPKFKMPDFEKFDGTRCPRTHLVVYCQAMAACSDDEKLMMHCFQSSLTGSAIRWYIQQDKARVRTWKDLANAFVTHYHRVTEMTPDRMMLQEMEKKPTETFREYAYRWRDMSIQVDPPVSDREAISLFVSTLKDPYRTHLRGATPHDFMDIVAAGGRIEGDIKAGIVKDNGSETGLGKRWTNRKKEEEAQMIQGQFNWKNQYTRGGNQWPKRNFGFEPMVNQTAHTGTRPQIVHSGPPNQQAQDRNVTRNFQRVDPIPMTYAELFPQLRERGMVSAIPGTPVANPPPQWYDPGVRCEYHANSLGHTIDRCWAFKHKVQSLRDAGWLAFDDKQPGVQGNPLPKHEEGSG